MCTYFIVNIRYCFTAIVTKKKHYSLFYATLKKKLILFSFNATSNKILEQNRYDPLI